MAGLKIPFNKPYIVGNEIEYIQQAVASGHISGNGEFSKKCQDLFEKKWGFRKCLITTSCTDALEMSAMLLDIQPGDEIIVPSYTFVSSALAFVREGAKIIFVDSQKDHPNIDLDLLENHISPKTRAIVIMHYGGISVDMDFLLEIVKKYKLVLIEDAAHAIDATYKNRPLGSFGDMATFSFHETKNIISGEGGMLVINNPEYESRAEIIWEKGTNRASFFKGEVNKYGWVDTGSSFLPSEITSAFLFGQLEKIQDIQDKRTSIWQRYNTSFTKYLPEEKVSLPVIPEHASINGHVYYLIVKNESTRDALISHLKEQGIHAVFHYLPLHLSDYYLNENEIRKLPNSEKFSKCLIRLPLYFELSETDQQLVIDEVIRFFK